MGLRRVNALKLEVRAVPALRNAPPLDHQAAQLREQRRHGQRTAARLLRNQHPDQSSIGPRGADERSTERDLERCATAGAIAAQPPLGRLADDRAVERVVAEGLCEQPARGGQLARGQLPQLGRSGRLAVRQRKRHGHDASQLPVADDEAARLIRSPRGKASGAIKRAPSGPDRRAMRSAEIHELAEQAARAQGAGEPDAAVPLLERLTGLAPDEPQHWKELGRCYQELGRPLEALAALVRAAARYTDQGAGIQAIAVCKWILELDPTHTATIDRLAKLQESAGVARSAPSRMPSRRAVRRPDRAPLEEVMLNDVVDPQIVADAEGQREIPLDTPVAPVPAKRDAAEALDPRRAARGLVSTPLFGCLGARPLRRLIEATRLVRLTEGQVLFRQGDRADALYVVAEGAVVPIAEGPETAERTRLSVLEPGDFFGEIALVTDEPRNATVEALVDSQLLAIDREVVRSLLADEPEVLAVLLGFLRERLVMRVLATSPLFEELPRADAEQLIRSFRLLEVEEGSALVEQGAPARALFVVLAGALRVVQQRDGAHKELAQLTAGEPCGEMSLLDIAPAVASVVAARKSWVLLLPRDDFDRVVRSHPLLNRVLCQIAAARRERA